MTQITEFSTLQIGTRSTVPTGVKDPTYPVCGLTKSEISSAISFARIILIIGLVFIHYLRFPNVSTTLFAGLNTQSHPFATWLGSTVLFFFLSAVPLLSMISGWLFFSFEPEDAWKVIVKRMKRRIVSLYLPLVAWNAFFTIGIYAFFLAYPHHAFFNNVEYTLPFAHWLDWVNAVFGVTHRPIGFQFWFVRDLFVTALISPLLWLSIRYAPWLGALVLCICWLRHSHMLIFWRADVPFFFYLGALIHQKNFNITISLRAAIFCMAAYIVLVGIRALAPYVVDSHVPAQNLALDITTSLMRLAGVVSCWGAAYRLAKRPWGKKVGNYGGLAFFLHSAHWPLLIIIKIMLWPMMPGDGDASMLTHYLLSVTITVVIGLGLGKLLAHSAPRFFSLMNGGRLLKQTTA